MCTQASRVDGPGSMIQEASAAVATACVAGIRILAHVAWSGVAHGVGVFREGHGLLAAS